MTCMEASTARLPRSDTPYGNVPVASRCRTADRHSSRATTPHHDSPFGGGLHQRAFGRYGHSGALLRHSLTNTTDQAFPHASECDQCVDCRRLVLLLLEPILRHEGAHPIGTKVLIRSTFGLRSPSADRAGRDPIDRRSNVRVASCGVPKSVPVSDRLGTLALRSVSDPTSWRRIDGR